MRALDPSFYDGREQALVKHYLLGSYFEYCGLVIAHSGKFRRIVFIDGFTGPWGSRTEDFSDTSFGIALNILADLKTSMAAKGLAVDVQSYLIERDPTAFARLQTAVGQFSHVNVEAINGEFNATLPTLPIRRDDFVFLFIDPKAWNIDSQVVGAFTRKHRCEVLITFMSSFINRFIGVERIRETFDPLFARQGWVDEIPPRGERSKQDLYRAFAKTCRQVYRFDLVAQSEVLKPGRDEDHYVMFFGTNHPKGLLGFRAQQLKAIEVQIASWSTAKNRNAEPDMFSAAGVPLNHIPFALSDPRHECAKMQRYIQRRLTQVGSMTAEKLLLECAQRFIIKSADFNKFVLEEKMRGNVAVPAITGRKKVPGKDSIIVWTGSN